MGFLESLGLVNPSEEVEEVKEEVVEETKQAPQQVSTPKFAMASAPVVSAPGQIVGQVDSSLYEQISAAIEKNNIEGNDFLEFMQSLNGLSNLAVDENAKYSMVYQTLANSSGGMTKPHLIESLKFYLKVIENEKAIFAKEMAGATEGMVTSPQNEAEALRNSATEKANQIISLQEEIQNLNVQAGNLEATAMEAQNKIAQKEADFEATAAQISGQLTAYEEKINTYIN